MHFSAYLFLFRKVREAYNSTGSTSIFLRRFTELSTHGRPDFPRNNAEVVLVFPGKYNAPNAQIPLSLLHIASSILRQGFAVRILDMRVDDFHKFDIGNPIFVGISAIHDSQIRYGIEFAKKIRTDSPECPIVWGGVHPSLLPEQTLASQYVDIVVRGEGESIVAELANKLETG